MREPHTGTERIGMSAQTQPRREPSATASDPRFRPVTIDTQRDSGGVIRMRANEALPPYPDRFHDHLFQWAKRTPAQILLAERRPGQQGWATHQLCRGRRKSSRDCSRAGAARSGPGAAGDDPVRQCHRAPTPRARRDDRRHPVRADFGRLFAGEPGPRQAAAHSETARSRPGLCGKRYAVSRAR